MNSVMQMQMHVITLAALLPKAGKHCWQFCVQFALLLMPLETGTLRLD